MIHRIGKDMNPVVEFIKKPQCFVAFTDGMLGREIRFYWIQKTGAKTTHIVYWTWGERNMSGGGLTPQDTNSRSYYRGYERCDFAKDMDGLVDMVEIEPETMKKWMKSISDARPLGSYWNERNKKFVLKYILA